MQEDFRKLGQAKNLVESERFQLMRLTGARLNRFEFELLLKSILNENELFYIREK